MIMKYFWFDKIQYNRIFCLNKMLIVIINKGKCFILKWIYWAFPVNYTLQSILETTLAPLIGSKRKSF